MHFRSLTEGISATGSMGRAMLTIMSAFAQLERDQLDERTNACMAAAAGHGRKARRVEATTEHAKVKHTKELKSQGLKRAGIGKVIGTSSATAYQYLSLGEE